MNTETVEFTHVTQVNFNQNDHNVEWVGQDKKFHFNFDEKNKQHQTICNWLHASRLYEADVSNFLRAVVKPGDYTVDVGANIGMHTLLMSTLVENTGKVVAFEPSLENVDELKEICFNN